jgi:hypothetical protein
VSRTRLGGYLAHQSAEAGLEEAVSRTETDAVCEMLFSILTSTIPVTRESFDSAPWQGIAEAISAVRAVNRIPKSNRFSILRFGQKGQTVPWDYPERGTILWVHILARAYGWPKDEILNLWPEDAIGLLQEINADEQLDREFQHSLAEISYEWNKQGQGKYKALQRPGWMRVHLNPKNVVTRLRKRALPLGIVVTGAGHGDEQAPSGN